MAVQFLDLNNLDFGEFDINCLLEYKYTIHVFIILCVCVCVCVCVETLIVFFFWGGGGGSLINRLFKRKGFVLNRNILFNQFNMSLLNKSRLNLKKVLSSDQ